MQPKPTIGRIVHYVADGLARLPKGSHWAAIITKVYSPSSIAACVFAEQTNLHVSISFDPAARPGTWHWPERDEPSPQPRPATLPPHLENSAALGLITNERRRNVERDGNDVYHDAAAHADGQLLTAAILVAADAHPGFKRADFDGDPAWARIFAGHVQLKHGGDRIERLVVAAALLAAEIDRLLFLRGSVAANLDSSRQSAQPAAPAEGNPC